MTRKKPAARKAISLLLLEKREIGAAEFKARCLEVMDEVERLGVEVTVTKHRRPVVRIVPVRERRGTFCGALGDAVVRAGDLVSPLDVPWDHDAPTLA